MDAQERRSFPRYKFRYPIIVSSSRAINCAEGWHYGEILDASRNGIRLRVNNFGELRVGTKLQLICQPASNFGPNNDCMPIPIQGQVIWENSSTNEFALRYLQ
ncbi:MAG TPA: hypothetical protein DDY20_11535 [Desulfobulbaceae bacterium]|nr:hypothetical protein [Desulfobulbaceae bacterium]